MQVCSFLFPNILLLLEHTYWADSPIFQEHIQVPQKDEDTA